MTETHATTEHAALYHCFNHVTLPRRSPALTGLDTDSQPVWLGSGLGGVGVLEATREPQPHLGSAFTGSGTLAEPRKHRPLHHAALWLLGRALCDKAFPSRPELSYSFLVNQGTAVHVVTLVNAGAARVGAA